MLTPSLKSAVQRLWEKFWSGGISNPLNAIEQITYLLFMKQLDENDLKKQSDAQFLNENYLSIFTGTYKQQGSKEETDKAVLRWGYFSKRPADEMFVLVQSKVFPFIKELNGSNTYFTKHMNNAVFLIPKASLLVEAVKTIDEIYDELKKADRFIDAQGDIYEYLLGELKSAGKNGQFRTPTHIIELIVELTEPKLGNRIADPACGTAGFLLGAYKYMITQYTSPEHCKPDENGFVRGTLSDKLVDDRMVKVVNEETFYGFDIDPTMIRIGLMNLMMHGISLPKIDYKDTLSKHYNEDGVFDIVLANPPFTGSIDKGELNETFSLDTKKTELLFVERIYKMLRIGGTAGVIVPQGVLFGSGKAFVDARKILVEKCELRAVISMPSGVFKPYAGVSTAILVFTKGGETENVWFYEMKSDGWSLDDKRNPITKNNGERDFGDLHTIIEQFKNPDKSTDRSQQHFLVTKKEIVDNDYDLSLSKYKEEIYEETKYEKPMVILEKLEYLETEIQTGLKELKAMI